MLFPNEIGLFEEIHIRPYLAIGKSLTHASFRIIAYQLTENVCPHLKDNSCTIYHERPNSCRGYPFVSSKDKSVAYFSTDKFCTVIKKKKNEFAGVVDLVYCESMKAKFEGMERLQVYNILRNRKIRRWIYDLRTEKWKRRSK